MLPDMARGAYQPLLTQRGLVRGIVLDVSAAPGPLNLGQLLREWCMTGLAEEGILRILLKQVDELSQHPWAHTLSVAAALPILVWHGMAGAAVLGRQGGLDGRKRRGGWALRWNRALPVLTEERHLVCQVRRLLGGQATKGKRNCYNADGHTPDEDTPHRSLVCRS